MNINSDVTQQQYAIKVNGKIIAQFTQRYLAENKLSELSPDTQTQAEIVIIDATGREILFG